MYTLLFTSSGDVSLAPICFRQRTRWERPAANDEELAVSRIRGAATTRVPVEEHLEHRASPATVHCRGSRLAATHVNRPEAVPRLRRHGHQAPVEVRVVEVVEGNGRRELDERGSSRGPVEPIRRPDVAGADVQVLRAATEHRRHDRGGPRGRSHRRRGIVLRRGAHDVAAVAVLADVVGGSGAAEQDKDAGEHEEAAHPPDHACNSTGTAE